MRAIDRWAIEEQGVPSLELMERAGTGVASEVERLAPDGAVAVVCGKGNNGGDGLVVARLLRERSREVHVLIAGDPAQLSGDALSNLKRLPGEPPLRMDGSDGAPRGETGEHGRTQARAETREGVDAILGRSAAIVDALLGTGFQGTPRGEVAEGMQAIRRAAPAGTRVVSVDVPSGVDASSGAIAGDAVRADVTVTFHASKPGLWIAPGKHHTGEVRTIDIGIPRGAAQRAGAPQRAACGLIRPEALRLLPRRTARSTKFSSGHVVVAGGSVGLMGAPAMTALAAMRAGAGYVTVCAPRSQARIVDAQLFEAMTRGLPEESGGLTAQGVEEVLQALSRAGALVLGPGLGPQKGAVAFARDLAAKAPVPTLIDADGLNAHSNRLDDLRARTAPTVLTPHAGELGRLLGCDSEEIERERLRHARCASERSGAVVVLKGDDTLIASPDGRVAVSPGGAPGLATAGSGDVLSGVIAALLAQGLDAFSAASAGVLLHIRAGREAARRLGGPNATIASDVISALPHARAEGGGA